MALDLAFDAIGDGPPVLILHGLFGSGSNWWRIARELSAAHRVALVDLRNHGASPWADTMDYTEMADDVLRLVESRRLERPAVIGHSMGGKVAMALALREPGLLSHLTVVDIAPVAYVDRLSPFAQAMRSIDLMQVHSREEIRQRLVDIVPDPAVVPFLMQNLVSHNAHFDWRVNVGAILAAMPALCHFPAQLRRLRYDGPVQVLAGAGSDHVASADAREFLPMFPQARVQVIPGAGHWVHADQPAAVIAAIEGALRGSAPAAAH